MRQKTRNEIRCYCRRQPLLATYGIDESGKVYLHVKVYKSRRIFGEVLVTEGTGTVSLRCRECMRWFTVPFRHGKPHLVESPVPESIADEAPVGVMFDSLTHET
jgi:hypothetical protein